MVKLDAFDERDAAESYAEQQDHDPIVRIRENADDSTSFVVATDKKSQRKLAGTGRTFDIDELNARGRKAPFAGDRATFGSSDGGMWESQSESGQGMPADTEPFSTPDFSQAKDLVEDLRSSDETAGSKRFGLRTGAFRESETGKFVDGRPPENYDGRTDRFREPTGEFEETPRPVTERDRDDGGGGLFDTLKNMFK